METTVVVTTAEGVVVGAAKPSPITTMALPGAAVVADEAPESADGAAVLVTGADEDAGAAVVAQPEFRIRIGLGDGDAQATVWTCDFSYDYVKINAEYRT